ncbi:hypothetical protein E2C01_065386 [Portunus trituberculatus]|uniref:K Homology domain-containing protein n=1 Tax=Portunus trituberculatus TaxID=210409 RepID=A0A5B7HPF4_PORTR|nr:hypothetical protein [Portunus trituberculatus]
MSEQTEQISTKKKMKKGSRFLKGLKKLLCCCWCKAQQQDEEANEYVVAEHPSQDEGKKDDVCEESGSLADSTSEKAQSLPVTCGQSPECESAQSLSEESEALEDPVREAEQTTVIDEELIAKIYALIDEEALKSSATEAPERVEEQGKANRQTESSAAKRRRRRKKKKAHHKEEDDGGEWQVVGKKRKCKKSEAVVTPAAITPAKPEPQSVSRKAKEPRRGNKYRRQKEHDKVRLSWQESIVKVAVTVPPNRRRHVIGTRGDTIRELQQQYPSVRVSVPLPQDLTSREVIIEGPKTQANAVALQITRRLQAIEKKLREAEQRRQERKIVVTKVEVPPDMRRHVVGPRGEMLRRLAQEHPAVRVTVPPPSDTHTASVRIMGPRHEAALVADCISASVHAAGQRQRQRQTNKRKQ